MPVSASSAAGPRADVVGEGVGVGVGVSVASVVGVAVSVTTEVFVRVGTGVVDSGSVGSSVGVVSVSVGVGVSVSEGSSVGVSDSLGVASVLGARVTLGTESETEGRPDPVREGRSTDPPSPQPDRASTVARPTTGSRWAVARRVRPEAGVPWGAVSIAMSLSSTVPRPVRARPRVCAGGCEDGITPDG
jgi:hypothetical protein